MRNYGPLILMFAGFAFLGFLPVHAEPPPRKHQLLAVAQGDNAVVLFTLEGQTLTLSKRLPIGKGARELCVAPDGKHAYVSNGADNTVTVIDLVAQTVAATIPLPGIQRPDGCTVSPDSRKLYVTGFDSDDVFILSTETNRILKHLTKMGKEPRRVLFTPDGRRYYVSAEGGDEILILDAATDAVVDHFTSGGHAPRMMLFLPDGKTLLVTNVDDDSVSLIDTGTKAVNLTIGAGGSPQRLAVSSDGHSAFVLSVLEEKISIIDLKGPHIRAKKFVLTGHGPYGMAMSDDHALLFVSDARDNEIRVYDTAAMTALPNGPRSQLEPIAKVTLNAPMGLAFR